MLNNRGGVCYELNGLFHHLLQELGYEAHLMAGTVFVAANQTWALENAHLLMKVSLKTQDYLVDFGFGGSCPRVPVPINGEAVVDRDGNYRVTKDETETYYYLQKDSGEGWEILYRFSTALTAWDLEQIHPYCVATETAPETSFTKGYFLSRVTEDGRITLLGNTLITVKGNDKFKEKLENPQIEEAARRYFELIIKLN
ncbi:arylamine N-acetyltransferase [Paenibacillus sp. N1-5-1-14]|nr:arylamine N-acetyltransferase [Paenibacillus radicibacter]MCR8642702.1 arylamine N-acetyltransferase [Paenibacillus radicibacter]